MKKLNSQDPPALKQQPSLTRHQVQFITTICPKFTKSMPAIIASRLSSLSLSRYNSDVPFS